MHILLWVNFLSNCWKVRSKYIHFARTLDFPPGRSVFVCRLCAFCTSSHTRNIKNFQMNKMFLLISQNIRFYSFLSWPSSLVHWTQVVVLSECGFESRQGWSWCLCPWARHLNHNCFVLRMGRKAVGPVCCVMHVKEPRTLIVKEKGLAPVFLDSCLEHPAGWICAQYKSPVLLSQTILYILCPGAV